MTEAREVLELILRYRYCPEDVALILAVHDQVVADLASGKPRGKIVNNNSRITNYYPRLEDFSHDELEDRFLDADPGPEGC